MLQQQKALHAVIFCSATETAYALAFHALQGLLEVMQKPIHSQHTRSFYVFTT